MMEVEIGGRKITVNFAMDFGVPEKAIINSTVFRDCKNRLDPQLTVKSILIQSVDMFGSRVGFLKLMAEVVNVQGIKLPGICFLRGGTVVMMPRILCEGTLYTLLTEQARVPIGSANFLALPAGMIDGNGNFSGTAAKEIQEETGLHFKETDLIDISPNGKPIYLSPGGSDEYARLFTTQKIRMSRKELMQINKRIMGNSGEGEIIKVKVIPLKDLFNSTQDGSTFIMIAAYNAYFGQC